MAEDIHESLIQGRSSVEDKLARSTLESWDNEFLSQHKDWVERREQLAKASKELQEYLARQRQACLMNMPFLIRCCMNTFQMTHEEAEALLKNSDLRFISVHWLKDNSHKLVLSDDGTKVKSEWI